MIENDVMASIEQTMMKVQRILTGPMGLRVTLDKDRFRVSFEGSSTALMVRVAELAKVVTVRAEPWFSWSLLSCSV